MALPPGMPPPEIMAMILPKGIVANTQEVYAEVARYPVIPIEKICEYWQVYTTTTRGLKDPTAHRLENFWWHVWGSDRKNLSGRTLAALFEHISEGPTFVPLRGPPNRYEGPPVPRFCQHEQDKRQASRLEKPKPTRPGREEGIVGGSDPKPSGGLHDRTPSAARPTPSHSILKKSRGPSTSGPRPTARFVSPHESENEANMDVAVSSVLSNASIGRSPKPEKKSPVMTSKKFVASSASKRRPILPRRTSSQASGSEAGSKDGVSCSAGSRQSTIQGSVSPIPEKAALAEGTAPFSPTSQAPPEPATVEQAEQPVVPSAKALGKRPVVVQQRPALSAPRTSSTAEGSPIIVQAAPPRTASASAQPPHLQEARQARAPQEYFRPSRAQETSQAPAPPATTAPTRQKVLDDYISGRRPSRGGSQQQQTQYQFRPRQGSSASLNRPHLSPALPPSVGLIASSTVAEGTTSRVAAEGRFDSEHQTEPPALARSTPSRGIMEPSPTSRARTALQPTFSPTPPKPTPPMPFGRTKSQLTLLLALDKERAKGGLGRGQA